MFKKPKTLYTLTPSERTLVEHFAAQIAMGQLAMQKLLDDIGARERMPVGTRFDAGRYAFIPAAEPEKKE